MNRWRHPLCSLSACFASSFLPRPRRRHHHRRRRRRHRRLPQQQQLWLSPLTSKRRLRWILACGVIVPMFFRIPDWSNASFSAQEAFLEAESFLTSSPGARHHRRRRLQLEQP